MPSNKFSISHTLNKNKVFLLNKSEIEKRFDPQFYKEEFKKNVARITKGPHKRLGEVVRFSNETWNQIDYFTSTFPYIEISEIDTLSGDILNISDVEKEKAPSRAKMIVRQNDILISTTRPNRGAISLIKKENDFSIASTGFSVIRETIDPSIHREYLFSVLRQHFLLMQFEQRSSGGNYPAITQEELSNTVIPVPNEKTQDQVISIFQDCFSKKKQNEAEAEKLLASIDDYLLKELGITLPALPENTLMNRMSFRSIKNISADRFDPFYHQQYFKDVFYSMNNGEYEYSQIKNYALFKPGFAFKSNDYLESSDCILITIKNIKQNLVDISEVTYLPEEYFEIYKDFQIKENDLLIAMTGATIGKVGIYEHQTDALLNQRNGIIRSDKINTTYLMSLLNLPIFQKIILRNSNGGAQPNISENDIMRIYIPLPPLSKQKEIAEHIAGIRNQTQELRERTKTELEKTSKEIENILLS